MAELFRTAPREVLDYLGGREVKPSWRWRDVAPHEHALAFTAARTAGFDVVGDIRDAMRKAVVERQDFETFSKSLTPILQEKGWWGKKTAVDPLTGKTEVVQLGSVRRLETIYWANTASAHAAGEWARTQATKDVLPYLQYKISLSERRRREHEGWVGTTLPVDHPWWRTHYPPNGWRCKCRVEQIGDYRAEQVPPEKRRAPPLNPRTWKDKRTGKMWRVPEGIDPGWQRNPGRTREIVAAAEQRRVIRAASGPDATPAAQHDARRTIIGQMRRTPEFRSLVENALGYDPRQAQSMAMRAIGAVRLPVASIGDEIRRNVPRLTASVLTLDARLAAKTLREAAKGRGDRPGPMDWPIVQAVLDAPEGITETRQGFDAWASVDGRVWLIGVDIVEDEARLRTMFAPEPDYIEAARQRRRRRDRE
jgi:hypothetical protein